MIDINMTLVAQILNFLILVLLLRVFAYNPVVKMLKEREKRIAASIDKADADAAEAEKTLQEYKDQLTGAREKATEIVDKAQRRAEEDHAARIAETKQEIEQMKKNAALEIERERERAVEKLRSEVVELSLVAAGKILQKNLDAADNEKLIGEFIGKLDKSKIGDVPC